MAVNYAGTISVTNGSAVVTGTGTEWTTLTVASDYILVTADGTICKVSALASSTELTLTKNYAGVTASNVEYEIFPTIGADVELGLLVKAFIDDARDIIDGGTALLAALQAAYDTWIADRQAEFDAAQSQRATDFTAAQDARASQFATDRAQQDLDIANAMNGLEGAPIAKAIPGGAIAIAEVNPWKYPGTNWVWMLDHSKSWAREERITTTYLGVHANEAAARAVAGAQDGDWYWNDTDKRCYSLAAVMGQTEHDRFGAAHFDAQFAVAYSDRVVLVDGDGVPWMVFEPYVHGLVLEAWRISRTPTSIAFIGSTLLFGTSNGSTSGVVLADFASDKYGRIIENSALSGWAHGIATRGSETLVEMTGLQLPNATVNAVAATVLPNAPADPVTGLPVPTIAVATDGGVSVINGPQVAGGPPVLGHVVSITHSTYNICKFVGFTPDGGIFYQTDNGGSQRWLHVDHEIPVADASKAQGYSGANSDEMFHAVWTSTYTGETGKTPVANVSGGAISAWKSTIAIVGPDDLGLIVRNPSNPSDYLAAAMGEDYATPMMLNGVKAALFCERGAASLVGGEIGPDLSSYADQAAAVSDGWSSVGSAWSFDAVNDEWVHDGSANSNIVYDTDPLIVGEPYVAQFDVENGGGVTFYVGTGSEAGSYQVGLGVGSHTVTLLAGSQGNYIQFRRTSGAPQVKNIRFSRATPDRSVNGKHAVIHGTLSRDADGWVSGFTASDYIEQPYNSDLDFGTGDFYVGGEFNTNLAIFPIVAKQDGSDYSIILGCYSTGQLWFATKDNGGATYVIAPYAPATSNNDTKVMGVRRNGVLELWVNGHLLNSSSGTVRDVSGASDTLNIGYDPSGNGGTASVSTKIRSVLIGANAPSHSQIPIMQGWKGDVIEGTIRDTSYVESTQGLWVLTSAYCYEIGPDGAERSKQVNDIGATTLVAFHGGRLVS